MQRRYCSTLDFLGRHTSTCLLNQEKSHCSSCRLLPNCSSTLCWCNFNGALTCQFWVWCPCMVLNHCPSDAVDTGQQREPFHWAREGRHVLQWFVPSPGYITMPIARPEEDKDKKSWSDTYMASPLHVTDMVCVVRYGWPSDCEDLRGWSQSLKTPANLIAVLRKSIDLRTRDHLHEENA